MARQPMHYTDHYATVVKAMTSHGLLLGSYDAAGKPNVMTIGWGSAGTVWGVPVWIVLVRRSRYTFHCIEHSACFSVNVPTEAMGMACVTAGSGTGRDRDKFAAAGLTAEKGTTVLAPTVAECPVVYECQVVHSSDVLPEKLCEDLAGLYVDESVHRIYFGQILSARAAANAPELLAG
jgi:flavin reductase (DIM6/NTAB) family NADH-FMN oxidoreductase RutF